MLESFRSVYHNDALAEERNLAPEDRLQLHQEHSGPVMKSLHDRMEAVSGTQNGAELRIRQGYLVLAESLDEAGAFPRSRRARLWTTTSSSAVGNRRFGTAGMRSSVSP